jgi:hypothetical protein
MSENNMWSTSTPPSSHTTNILKIQSYCGITIKWDYRKRTADLSMPGHIANALHKFRHPKSKRPPHDWTEPTYGAKVQYAPPTDTTERLPDDATKRIQKIVGTLMYYARAADCTLQIALGTIAAQQSKAEATATAVNQLLDYCATHPDAALQFNASNMILPYDSTPAT